MFQMLCSSSFTYSGFKWASDFATCVLGVERKENAMLRTQKSPFNMMIKSFILGG